MIDHKRLRIKREAEARTGEISQMINEGGLGADYYYDIEKDSSLSQSKDDTNKKDK